MFDYLRKELEQFSRCEGIRPSDLLILPSPLDTTIGQIMRRGSMTLQEMAGALRLHIDETQQIGDILIAKGFLTVTPHTSHNETIYTVRLAPHRRTHSKTGLWTPLDNLS